MGTSSATPAAVAQIAADHVAVADQLVLFDQVDHRRRRNARHGIAAKGGDGRPPVRVRNLRASPPSVQSEIRCPGVFAAVIMSGSTSQCSMPNHPFPVRPQPVCTSSAMKSPPYFFTMENAILKYSLGGVIKPPYALDRLGNHPRNRPRGGRLDDRLDVFGAGHLARRVVLPSGQR
jgi:hypothetical protein